MATDKEILLKLTLDKKQAEKELLAAKKSVEGLKESLIGADKRRKEGRALNDLYKKSLVQVTQATKNLTQATATLSATKKTMASSVKDVSSGMMDVSKSSGSATSAALEFGRVIQDSNYGIRGMANNITQLASQIAFTAKSAGGLGNAFKAIFKTMIGPAGILIAISAVVAALERFSMQKKESTDELYKGEAAAAAAASNLKILQETLEEGLLTQEEANRAVNKANQEYEGLNLKLDENNQLTDESTIAITRKIKALEMLAKAQAIQSVVEEEYSKIARNRANIDAELAKEGTSVSEVERKNKELEIELEKTADSQKRKLLRDYFTFKEKQSRRSVASFRKDEEESLKKITKLMEQLGSEDLVDELFTDKKKGGRGRADRVFKDRFLDLEKEINSFNKTRESMEEKHQRELLKIRQEYEAKDLKKKFDDFKTKEEKRLADYLADIKNHKNFEKLKKDATDKFDKEISDAKIEYATAESALKMKQVQEVYEFERSLIEKLNNDLLKANVTKAKANASANKVSTASGGVGKPLNQEGGLGIDGQIEAQRELMEAEDALFQERMNDKYDRLREDGLTEFQAKQLISAEQFAWQEEQNKREIDLENSKIEAKKNVNLEYSSWLGSFGNTMAKLAGDNEELAKAALIIEKGAAIADIVIKTQAANAQVSAIASVRATAGDVTAVPVATARILKNNIGSGLAIANILATSIKSSKKPSSGGGGGSQGGGGGRTFDFNLVGSTRQDQLAQSIGGKFDEPVRAYVVGNDISSRQELDNKIKTTATI